MVQTDSFDSIVHLHEWTSHPAAKKEEKAEQFGADH
jgi:hypothetical protein